MKSIYWPLVVAFFLALHSQAATKNSEPKNVIALPVGMAISGTVSLPGQEDRFTFSGSSGQRLYYDPMDLSNGDLNARLVSPRGETIFHQSHTTDSGPFYLQETGIYTLVLDGDNDAVGNYHFRILDLANATNMVYGATNSGSINPQSQTAMYQFTGTNGQRVQLESISASDSSANWRLISPHDEQLLAQNINSSSSEAVLPVAGTYLVLVEGAVEEATPLNYQIKVTRISEPTGTDVGSGFGSTRAGSTVLDQTNNFSFTSVKAGTVVYFDALTNVPVAYAQLLDPTGEQVFYIDASQDSGPYRLPRSGSYSLKAIGYATGNYRFRLLNCSISGAGVSDLALGSSNYLALNPALMTHVYRVTNAAVGQRLFYDALDGDFDTVNARFIGPNLAAYALYGQNADYDAGPLTINEPGTYYLLAESQSEYATNNFKFRLVDIAQSPTTNIVFNTVYSGRMPPLRSDVYAFSGEAGQRVYFDLAATNGSQGAVYVYGPNNQILGWNGLPEDMNIVLPQSGTQVVVFYSQAATNLSYKFSVITPPATTNALTLGATVSGNLTQAGEQHHFLFHGNAGQRLFYDALDTDADEISVWLEDSLGNNIHLNGNSDYDVGTFTLARAGIYTLTLKQVTPTAGNYSFRLIDLAQAPVVDLAFDTTISARLTPGSRNGIYRFSGVAGQKLFFAGANTNEIDIWYLYGPQDQPVFGGGIMGGVEVNLPQTGTYYLTVGYTLNEAPAGYSFHARTATVTTTVLTLGNTYSNLLAEAGDEHRFTFNGSLGQQFYYDALDTDFDAVGVYLLSPSGNYYHINGNSDNDAGPFTLTESGPYTLLQKTTTDQAALDYQFRLLDVGTATTMTYGTTVSGQINPQSSTRLYRFTGTGGDRINLESLAASTNHANWYVYNPANVQMNGGNIENSLGEIVLPISGAYVLTVVGTDPELSALDFQIRATLVSSGAGGASGFGLTHTGTTTFNQTNQYSYTAPAGLPIYLDNCTNTTAVYFQLLAPSGNQVFYFSGFYDSAPFYLPESGTYTLNVIGSTDGDYVFRLLNLNDATNLVFGTKYETNPEDFHADVFRFTGTNGQKLIFDALSTNTLSTVIATLYTPNNITLWNQYAHSDSVVLPLNESGTFYLMLSGWQPDSTNYHFRLLEATTPPAQAVALDTVVGGDLFPVPSSWLNLTGSYVNASLRGYAPNDDWRISQTIAGTRPETAVNFVTTNWGTLTSAGLAEGANGSDDDWENYSAQFDGTITITNPNTRLYLKNDNGARMWIDVNHNDAFEDSTEELVNSGWGMEFSGQSYGSPALTNGVYPLRIQFEETYGGNECLLLADSGVSLGAEEALLYRFTGTKGQRLYFDSLNPTAYAGWNLYDPNASSLVGGSLSGDFETILPLDGSYLMTLTSTTTNPVSYGFRLVTPATTTHALNFETTHAGVISEPAEEFHFTFNASAGQQIFYDALDGDPAYTVSVQLSDPLGSVIYSDNYAASDFGPLTLNRSGTYSLRLKGVGDATRPYRFRLLHADNAPIIAWDTVITNNLTEPLGAALYRLPVTPSLRLYVDHIMPLSFDGYHYVYNGNDYAVGGNWFGSDSEFTPAQTNWHLIVLHNRTTTTVPFSFQVAPGNHPPVLTAIGHRTVDELVALSFTASATDLEAPNDQLTYSLDAGNPLGSSINASSGAFTWTPTEAQGPGSYPITVRVTDDGTPSFSDFETITVTVNEINLPPQLTVPGNQTIDELTPLNVNASATDPDLPANSLTFALVSPPSGMTINTNTGAISWTPTESQGPATNTIFVKLTDNNPAAVNAPQISVTNTFIVTVNEVNVAPTLGTIANKTIDELTVLSVTNTASDSDVPANSFTYELLAAPTGASVNSSGVISWTPTEVQGPSTNTFIMRVTDNNPQAVNTQPLSTTNSFTIIVNEVNVAPSLTVATNQTLNELTLLTVTNSASDSDLPANNLTFAIVSGPAGTLINSTNGVLTWTPTEAQGPGTNIISVSVTDNGSPNLSVTNSFVITASEVNTAPDITLPPNQTISEMALFSASATANDSDLPANALTFALVSGPSGLNVATNGSITWTPAENQGPSTNIVTVKVTDNGSPNLSVTNNFILAVSEVNVAPVLTAVANRTINPGQILSITNSATDADLPANGLTFSLVTPPAGVGIGSSSGILTWRPTMSQANTTNTISVRVTDNGSPTLSDTKNFTVVVSPVTPVTLSSWLYDGSGFRLSVSGPLGPDYIIQSSSDLTNWLSRSTNTPVFMPFGYLNATASETNHRFFRVLLAP